MSDLGNLLKKARYEKGIDLDQLQDSTKIQKRYLEAIEEGNFSILPGNFYVRAFIKSYAEAVGLDPDEVLTLYRDVIPVSTAPQTEHLSKKRPRQFNSERFSKWMTTLLMWGFLLIIVIFVYIYVQYIYEPKDTDLANQPPVTDGLENNEPASPDDDINIPEPIQPPIVEEPELEPIEPKVEFIIEDSGTYVFNISQADQLELELTVSGERCWISLNENQEHGTVLFMDTIYQDDVKKWEVDHSLWLRLGNPGNVEVRVNDVLIDMEELHKSNPWNLQLNFIEDHSEAESL